MMVTMMDLKATNGEWWSMIGGVEAVKQTDCKKRLRKPTALVTYVKGRTWGMGKWRKMSHRHMSHGEIARQDHTHLPPAFRPIPPRAFTPKTTLPHSSLSNTTLPHSSSVQYHISHSSSYNISHFSYVQYNISHSSSVQ